MRYVTNDIRRATQDIDIDFIRYSLSEDSIDQFIKELNCLDGIRIVRTGPIEELHQQNYKGKRIYITIRDEMNNQINSKIDLGVHKHMNINQQEYCFDVAFDKEGASLLINTQEQMFTEKLKQLLKFGSFSTRYKDIYDMYYQCGKLDKDKFIQCFDVLIFSDNSMREKNIFDICKRIQYVFNDKSFKSRVNNSDKRWLDDDINKIFATIRHYLKTLSEK